MFSNGDKAIEWLRANHGDSVVSVGEYRGQHWAQIKLSDIQSVCAELKSNPETSYDFLVDVTAVHWPGQAEPIEIVYHLYSYATGDRLRLKTRAAEGAPIPTVATIWRSADWNERETYDMFGIEFEGHPDLRRILMPDDYTDYPLRKEFPLYRG